MAKGKKKRSKQGLFSKAMNIALILLGFSRPIELLIRSPSVGSVNTIIREATFGLSEGKLDLKAGANLYSRGLAAVGLGTLKSYLMKKFPVRG